MRRTSVTCLLALCLGGLLPGCALLSKGQPREIRYFTPQYEAESGRQPTPASTTPAPPGLSLRLGRVSAAANLRERIAYRASELEISYYETRRWNERPSAYLEQALSRALFERHGLSMVVSGQAPTLQLELTAFEEIQQEPHRVRVEVTMVLHHDNVARVHETIRVEQKVPEPKTDQMAEAVVQAFSLALNDIVARIGDRTVAALTAIAAETPPEAAALNATRASNAPP